MHEEIDAINQILPTATAGSWEDGDAGRKAIALRTWIDQFHRRLLDEAGVALPRDIVMNNVLPFLASCHHTRLKWRIMKMIVDDMEEDGRSFLEENR